MLGYAASRYFGLPLFAPLLAPTVFGVKGQRPLHILYEVKYNILYFTPKNSQKRGVCRVSFCVVHMQKIKAGGLRGIQSHNQRERESRSNPDIDYSRSADNYDLQNEHNISYNQRVNEIIADGRTSDRAVRKDAVVMCNFVVTSDKGFFDGLTDDKQAQFFRDSREWFANRYGGKNIVHATVHLDETTPHMHLGLVPITADGRLSAKDIFTKKEMADIQTDFARDIGQKYGLQRGVEGSDRTHLSETQFKAVCAAQKLQNTQKGIESMPKAIKRFTGAFKRHRKRIERQDYSFTRNSINPSGANHYRRG